MEFNPEQIQKLVEEFIQKEGVNIKNVTDVIMFCSNLAKSLHQTVTDAAVSVEDKVETICKIASEVVKKLESMNVIEKKVSDDANKVIENIEQFKVLATTLLGMKDSLSEALKNPNKKNCISFFKNCLCSSLSAVSMVAEQMDKAKELKQKVGTLVPDEVKEVKEKVEEVKQKVEEKVDEVIGTLVPDEVKEKVKLDIASVIVEVDDVTAVIETQDEITKEMICEVGNQTLSEQNDILVPEVEEASLAAAS